MHDILAIFYQFFLPVLSTLMPLKLDLTIFKRQNLATLYYSDFSIFQLILFLINP